MQQPGASPEADSSDEEARAPGCGQRASPPGLGRGAVVLATAARRVSRLLRLSHEGGPDRSPATSPSRGVGLQRTGGAASPSGSPTGDVAPRDSPSGRISSRLAELAGATDMLRRRIEPEELGSEDNTRFHALSAAGAAAFAAPLPPRDATAELLVGQDVGGEGVDSLVVPLSPRAKAAERGHRRARRTRALLLLLCVLAAVAVAVAVGVSVSGSSHAGASQSSQQGGVLVSPPPPPLPASPAGMVTFFATVGGGSNFSFAAASALYVSVVADTLQLQAASVQGADGGGTEHWASAVLSDTTLSSRSQCSTSRTRRHTAGRCCSCRRRRRATWLCTRARRRGRARRRCRPRWLQPTRSR